MSRAHRPMIPGTKMNTRLHALPSFFFLQSLFLSLCCILCFHFECLPGRFLFLTFFPLLCFFLSFPSPPTSFHLQIPLHDRGPVRITHSHTSESMSFTYQRTHQSVCIDTRPSLHSAHTPFDSEDEEECAPALPHVQPPEAEPAGDRAWRFKPGQGMQMNSATGTANVCNLAPLKCFLI